ncbi:16S rRNA (cytosine(1402)-N(4))-methyltransferase RsmH [Patescibacteria group bacterium]|nr:16S rRNA (cytosine(1402)-N(4))-methyltransferase RsmH [Patescibacteria group bacterium]
MIHAPVLLQEVIDVLQPRSGDTVIDGTAGAGGHAEALRARIGSGAMLLVDWDEETVQALEKEVRSFPQVRVAHGNYADIPELQRTLPFPKADVALLDLGFSSDQLLRGKGFSFQKREEPLVMTYSAARGSLRDALRSLSEGELAEIITAFGEERYAKKIAKAIVARRNALQTVGDLSDAIVGAVPKSYEHGRIHPATRTFQALRIYINDELGNLAQFLRTLPEIMKPGGRVAIISFHSLEDRIVKTAFHDMEHAGIGKRITRKPISASFEEVARNPRARSAKLRAFTFLPS